MTAVPIAGEAESWSGTNRERGTAHSRISYSSTDAADGFVVARSGARGFLPKAALCGERIAALLA